MQISQKLPKFHKTRSLLLIISKHSLEIYLASDEKIKKVDELKIEIPTFSDREGFFERSGKGEVYRSGAVYEDQKNYIRKQLSIQSQEKISKNVDKYNADAIYLFAPSHLKNIIKDKLSEKIKKLIKMEFTGHFVGEHPFTYIKKIQEKEKREKDIKLVKPIKEDAYKILKRNEGMIS